MRMLSYRVVQNIVDDGSGLPRISRVYALSGAEVLYELSAYPYIPRLYQSETVQRRSFWLGWRASKESASSIHSMQRNGNAHTLTHTPYAPIRRHLPIHP